MICARIRPIIPRSLKILHLLRCGQAEDAR
jgi:hypothetical protein